MRKFTLFVSAAALAVGGAGVALADHHAGKRGPMAADTNGDGEITLAEAKAHGAERFAKMDANGDGELNKADREAKRAERFAATDTNGDGELSADEMAAAREARQAERAERRAERQADRFARLDTDNSGGLSEAELAAGHEARAERRGPRGEMQRGGGRSGKHGGHAMRMLRQADANGDETVTEAEFNAAIEARFAKVDTDGSGVITAEEREAAKAARMERRSERRGKRGEERGEWRGQRDQGGADTQ